MPCQYAPLRRSPSMQREPLSIEQINKKDSLENNNDNHLENVIQFKKKSQK